MKGPMLRATLGLAALALPVALTVRLSAVDPSLAPPALASSSAQSVPGVTRDAPFEPWLSSRGPGQYVGSESCRECHEDAYREWKAALHLQMTKPIAEARVVGDFSPGTHFEQHGRNYKMEQKDGRYFVTVSHRSGQSERFEAHFTLGSLRFQGYLSILPDGRIYVLPAFWNQEWKRWLDWREITPVPDTDHDLRQIWNITCFNCHATNLARNFSAETNTFNSHWTEMGIGCEGCHGPGRNHVELTLPWKDDPSRIASVKALKGDKSQLLQIFATSGAPRRQLFDTCAYCHGNKNNRFVGFVPGDHYDDYALPFLPSDESPDNDPQGDFWPDGRPSRFNRPQALMMSGCFERSDITCASCHNAHGSPNPQALKVPLDRSNELCTQCHKTLELRHSSDESRRPDAPSTASSGPLEGPALTAHTHHRADSAGSQCINCHMSEVNWRLLMRRRDHTFRAPVPEMTGKYGAPNACNECHDDRTPEWAAAAMDAWYGDTARRSKSLKLADTMYGAASGDRAVLADLAALAVDRSWGAPLRASAVQFLTRFARGQSKGANGGRLSQTSFEDAQAAPRRKPLATVSTPVPPVTFDRQTVNALIGAASDPEPIVRAQAAAALSLAEDDRAVVALAARLVDPSRVVRTMAAEALLDRGVTTLSGQAGMALAKAQDELASRLDTFPDLVADQLKLGWLELKRQREPASRSALQRVLALEPENLLARVWLGVLAAQGGRYDEAIDEWRQIRKKQPNYPNLNELIAEAERRKRGAGDER